MTVQDYLLKIYKISSLESLENSVDILITPDGRSGTDQYAYRAADHPSRRAGFWRAFV